MTVGGEVWTVAGRGIHVVASADAEKALPVPPPGTLFVARLDGARMRETQGVFEEFARWMRFPACFGWNWNAFADCLGDLAWLPADAYLIVIDRAGEPLADEPEDLDVFWRCVANAVARWAGPFAYHPDRRDLEVPFNVVCWVAPGESVRWASLVG